jgi:hypothetical protein
MTDVPILTQRRIEAAFAKGIFDEMKADGGILCCWPSASGCWRGSRRLLT